MKTKGTIALDSERLEIGSEIGGWPHFSITSRSVDSWSTAPALFGNDDADWDQEEDDDDDYLDDEEDEEDEDDLFDDDEEEEDDDDFDEEAGVTD